ncbi:MAG: helix-turn-helix domain-containing protein [Euryarchaeota archaeon]|nr:helix-turn-helix domain-containing protein [Euryarchaeota archaeon]
MKSLRLTVQFDHSTVHPLHRLVARHDAFEQYHLVHWNHSADGETVFVFHVVGDPAAYGAKLETLASVVDFEVAAIDDRAFYVYVRDRAPLPWKALLNSYTERNLLVLPPVEYRMDCSLRFTVVGESAELQAAIESVPTGIEITVDRIGEYAGTDATVTVLTDRQRELLRAARRLGYYDVPREAGVRAVAEEVGCAPGTAAEHLQKAEARLIHRLDL